jgi:uncharacterized protein YjeT (DUF2065 family)
LAVAADIHVERMTEAQAAELIVAVRAVSDALLLLVTVFSITVGLVIVFVMARGHGDE